MCERKVCSPPTLEAPNPAPWKASQNETVLKRPVAARATFSATSTASEPPVVNSTLPRSPPRFAVARDVSASASSTAGSQVKRRGAKGSSSSCALIAASSLGWP